MQFVRNSCTKEQNTFYFDESIINNYQNKSRNLNYCIESMTMKLFSSDNPELCIDKICGIANTLIENDNMKLNATCGT